MSFINECLNKLIEADDVEDELIYSDNSDALQFDSDEYIEEPESDNTLKLDDNQKQYLIDWLRGLGADDKANLIETSINGDWYLNKDNLPKDLVNNLIKIGGSNVKLGETKKLNEENKLIWGSNNSREYLMNLTDEDELRKELIKLGHPEGSVKDKTIDELKYMVQGDIYLDELEEDKFYNNIVPMIAAQTYNNMIIMAGVIDKWNGEAEGGKVVEIHELYDGDWNVDNIQIVEDEAGHLVWLGKHHDGTHKMHLFAIPKDKEDLVKFITDLGLDEYETEWYGYDKEEAVEMAIEDLSTTFLNDTISDWSKIKDVCKPIINGFKTNVTI